jgi:hypothetical protein
MYGIAATIHKNDENIVAYLLKARTVDPEK